jgi:dihydroorotate dehydrogenase (NAD+) catalytic subunit
VIELAQRLLGGDFQNPILLASGTCGFGRELAGVVDLETLGGLVTKAVTPEPRDGNPPLRVAEFDAGMLNSVGLANPGVAAFRADHLPWLRDHLRWARVLVNVAGRTVDDYLRVVDTLEGEEGFLGYELNVSCPNVREGGAIFCSRDDLLAGVIGAVRRITRRPLVAKLAPNVPDIAHMAEVAVAAGADALTLVNTFPGLVFDVETRRPVLGGGTGGVSGPALLPIGVYSVWQASRRVQVPIIGVGGIRRGSDVVQYLLAGASLVQIGTASFADPRAAQRVLAELRRFMVARSVSDVRELVGAGRFDTPRAR